jgi:hypothetical protein
VITSAAIPFWGGGGADLHLEEMNEWNTFKLDDELFPSAEAPVLVTEVTAPVAYNVDKRKRKNKNGNRKVVQGYKASPISITFLIWTEEQYRDWKERIPAIHPKYNADNRKPHKIYYPDLDDLDIHYIYIDKIEPPKWTGEWGIRSITIGGEEVYEDDKPATKKVSAPNKPDPNLAGADIDPDFISDDGPPAAP